jgi:hypothetical protein
MVYCPTLSKILRVNAGSITGFDGENMERHNPKLATYHGIFEYNMGMRADGKSPYLWYFQT